MDKVEAARREIAELKKQIAEPQRRITELEAFLRVADTIVIPTETAPVVRPRLARPPEVELDEGTDKPQTFKDQVIAQTEAMLSTTRWLKTKQIVERLEAAGVVINTKANKVVRVSSILVREKEKFVSSRKRGWSLRQKALLPKAKGLNARTLSPFGSTASVAGQPMLAAQPSN